MSRFGDNRMTRLTVILVLIGAVSFTGVAPSRVSAQTIAEAEASILVRSGPRQIMVPLAHVRFEGRSRLSGFTGSDGRAHFDAVPSGTYSVVIERGGYTRVTLRNVRVQAGQVLTVEVDLPLAGLRTIGAIHVSATNADPSTSVVTPTRRIFDTLADAVATVPGVNLTQDDAGVGGVSIDGHPASQTAFALDGIPIGGFGGSDLRSINTDLFASASIDRNASFGQAGGAINFRSLDPTLSWLGNVTGSYGTHSKTSYALSERGTLGAVGVSLAHAGRGATSYLDEKTYLDSSGFSYRHAGAAFSAGDLIKIRAPIGTGNAVSFTRFSTGTRSDDVCAIWTAAVPCGYGPAAASTTTFSSSTRLADAFSVRDTDVGLTLFSNFVRTTDDALGSSAYGVPAGSSSAIRTSTIGLSMNARFAQVRSHRFALDAFAQRSQGRATMVDLGSVSVQLPTTFARSFTMLRATNVQHASSKLTLTEGFGAIDAGAGIRLEGSLNASWRPTLQDGFEASLSKRRTGTAFTALNTISDPSGLRFDCDRSLAFGRGPGTQGGEQTTTSGSLTWKRTTRVGMSTATAYVQQQQGATLFTTQSGAAFAGVFPSGYFNVLDSVYASPLACGQSATLGPQNLVLTKPVSGLDVTYAGLRFAGSYSVGKSLVVLPTYALTSAQAKSKASALSDPLSDVVSGRQLPRVPLNSAGLTLDVRPPGSPLETLANLQLVGTNNGRGLPSYATLNLAASYSTPHGTVTISVTNVLNTLVNDFSSFAPGPGRITAGSSTLPTLANSLSRRSLTLSYTVGVGSGGSAPARSATSDEPEQQVQITPRALPATPPEAPFEVDSSTPTCTPEMRAAALPVLQAAKAMDAQIALNTVNKALPTSLPSASVGAVNLSYARSRRSYAIVMSASTFKPLLPLTQCARIGFAPIAQLDAKGFYTDSNAPAQRTEIIFAPEIGLYLVPHTSDTRQTALPLDPEPAAPPVKPFSLRATGCPSEFKPAAQALLAELESWAQTVGGNMPSGVTMPDIGATVGRSAHGWSAALDIHLADGMQALLGCAHVARVRSSSVSSMGLHAAPQPALNFSPSFGLYLTLAAE